jgi:hypothetical protein
METDRTVDTPGSDPCAKPCRNVSEAPFCESL